MKIKDLEQHINDIKDSMTSLSGQIELLESQYSESKQKLNSLEEEKEINKKATSVLTMIQKVTKSKIKNIFENVVTHALQFIHQSNDYNFELEFGKRGSIPELNFNVKTEGMNELHDLMNTRGGGTCDIVSLALRFVLLEANKTKGFYFGDEPFKHLDNTETIQKAMEFIQEIQKDTNRQIFIITHKNEVVEFVDNPIIF